MHKYGSDEFSFEAAFYFKDLVKIKHENLVQLKGLVVLTLRNVCYRITEYCGKGSLYDLLQTNMEV